MCLWCSLTLVPLEQPVCLMKTWSHSQEMLYRPKIFYLRSFFMKWGKLEIFLCEKSFANADMCHFSGPSFPYNIFLVRSPLLVYYSFVSRLATLLFFLTFMGLFIYGFHLWVYFYIMYVFLYAMFLNTHCISSFLFSIIVSFIALLFTPLRNSPY